MEEIFKNVNLLFIIHNDSILMRKYTHQDHEVIDVFFFRDNNDIDISIKNKLNSLFGKTFQYKYYGNIESVINKKGVIAYLTAKTYKVLLDEKYEVLSSYTDDVIKSGVETVWINKQEIKNETRLREGDRKIFERVFDDKNINIKMVEDQGERWIDAKTIVFENR